MRINNTKDLSAALAEQRKRLNKTQAEIADLTVLRQATISKFENSTDNITIKNLFKLLSALNLEIHITEKGNPKKDDASSKMVEW